MIKLSSDKQFQYLYLHITSLKDFEHSLMRIGSIGTHHVGKIGLVVPPYALVASNTQCHKVVVAQGFSFTMFG